MAFGAGYAGAGFGLALLTLGVLIAIARKKHSDFGGWRESTVSIVFNPDRRRLS